jgi:hypothetical protein
LIRLEFPEADGNDFVTWTAVLNVPRGADPVTDDFRRQVKAVSIRLVLLQWYRGIQC